MAKIFTLLVSIITVGSWGTPLWGGPIPAPLQGVTLSVQVIQDPKTAVFTYKYLAINPNTNEGQIRQLTVELSRRVEEAALSQNGLMNGPLYTKHTSESSFQQALMVPAGINGPAGWVYGLGFDATSTGFALWGSLGEEFRILPGQALNGFQLMSYGLPGIRAANILPGIDYDELPDEFTEPERARELQDNLIFHAMTIGPKAPPKDFIADAFLRDLIALLDESHQFGWIKTDGVYQSLLAKLTSALQKLGAGDPQIVKQLLQAFLNEVTATSCKQFTCPNNLPLTSEAYALLFFNGQYLLDRL